MSTTQQWQWQAPPGWPPPPQGWSPPPGWAPDPSWPPPPPGWVWWRLAPRPGRRRRVVGQVLLCFAAAAVSVVLLGGPLVSLLGVLGFGDPAGCGDGGPPALDQVDVRNDSAEPVVVGDCEGPGCMPAESEDRVSPGRVTTIHMDCTYAGDGLTSWQVTGAQGGVRGYLVLDTRKAINRTTVRVTALSPNRRTPTPTQNP